MAPHNAATEAELKAKHPPAQADIGPLPTTDASPLAITQMEVDKSVRKFGRGKAPGPSGMRPEHMKIIHQGAQNRRDRALAGLTRLVNAMVKGEVPETVAPYLSGARLHAGLKKDGGIRPIAVGNLLRRVVGRCVARSLADRAAKHLFPLQTGVGVRGGCEAIVHAARATMEKYPDKWLLQVDFINAFNCADRGSTLAEVARLFPEMLAWCNTCYGQPSHLQYGKTRILSTSGWHQGDALAALLFSLTLHPLALMIKEQLPGLELNTWFLDDGTQVGTLEELQQVVDIIQREGPRLGLHLSTSATSNRPKSTLWSPIHSSSSADDPLQRGVPVERSNGVTLLGAPVGDDRHLEEAIYQKVEKIGQVTAKLPLLKDPQTEYVLLRSCLALPKISFLLRVANTTSFPAHLQDFDRMIRESLARILGAPITNNQWLQARLPISLGGLGLRGAEDHAAGAHTSSLLSSCTLSRNLQGLQDDGSPVSLPQQLLDTLGQKMGEEATVETVWGLSQKMMSFKVDSQNLVKLKERVEGEGQERELARLNSLTLPYAGSWLLTPPIAVLGLHLRPTEFTLATRYRLGINVYDSDGPCPACQQFSDAKGDHALCCGHYGERITRHNTIRDHLFSVAQGAALGPVREGRFLLPGVDRRPADVLIPSWADGLDCALDVTVVNPLQVATVAQAAETAGHALTFAFERKMRGAFDECMQQGIKFIPIVAETLGGWDKVAVEEIKKLATAKARHAGGEEEEQIRRAFTKLSVLLMRGNAAILANRIPAQNARVGE